MMGFGFMGLVPLLIVGLIVWLAVDSTRRGGSDTSAPPDAQGQFAPPHVAREAQALEILNERYARGEIDRDEYLARRSDLT